jgi:D-3-phosphoglycerate dehydrogenase / 2-oxoglutarate reductase
MRTFMSCVFVDCTFDLERVLLARELRPPAHVSVNVGDPDAGAIRDLCAGRDTLLLEHTKLPAHFFETCPQVRRIVFMGTGAGTYVDLEQAYAHGVRVDTISGYGDHAVAEHALALTFAAARQIARMDREVRAGAWRPLRGLQLAGRKVAVIGRVASERRTRISRARSA